MSVLEVTKRLAIALTASLVTEGCVGAIEQEQDGPTGTTRQAIINGTALSGSTSNVSTNMVEVPLCSAVALNSEWVLTADHCVADGGYTAGTTAASLYYPAETKTIREIHRVSQTWDLALLRVHPFASADIKPFQLFNAPLTQLVGLTQTCVGRGYNTFTDGFGPWRSADLVLQSSGVGSNTYRLLPNASGQIQWHGDSGGPCLVSSGGVWKVAGINSQSPADASFHDPVGLNPLMSGLVEDVRQRSRMFFYDPSGFGWAPALERNGTFTTVSPVFGFGTWTQVVTLRNGAIFFYDGNTGAAHAGRLSKDGTYTTTATLPSLATGYTHATSVGADRVLFYNISTGAGRGVRLDALGNATYGSVFSIAPHITGWEKIVGTKDGALFLYGPWWWTYLGATGTLDANLNFTWVGAFDFPYVWTHIAAVNERAILFYNQASGVARTGQVSATGAFTDYGPKSGFGSQMYRVIGATNGHALLYSTSGTGKVARIDASGNVSFPQPNLSGMPTNGWPNASAE